MLIISLNNEYVLGIHFKMSGQLLLVKTDAIPHVHTRAIFHMQSGDKVFFNDQRMFGWIKIMTTDELSTLPFVQKLGPEPWDISDNDLYKKLHNKHKAIKVAIIDQDTLAGVGNIYANDGLWEAKIHPLKQTNQLTKKDVKQLRNGLILVLQDGITYGGATVADEKYRSVDGSKGKYQQYVRVYDRAGKSCLRNDGGIIKKITVGGRGTYFCPVCQKS